MLRLPSVLAVFCGLSLVSGTVFAEPGPTPTPPPTGPLPPKHVSSSDSRFQIAVPEGVDVGDYSQLGDDPKLGTPISFTHPQQVECTAAGARAFKVQGATAVTVDLTRGDVPMINFTFDGVPRALLLPAPSMACALTGETSAGIGVVATIVKGGTNAGNAGFTNFDAPQTITCFERGRPVSQTYAIALSLGAANGFVGLSYTDENGQPATYEYDGHKTACLVETVGQELTKVKDVPSRSSM